LGQQSSQKVANLAVERHLLSAHGFVRIHSLHAHEIVGCAIQIKVALSTWNGYTIEVDIQ
jgi:hypothetical protein